MWADLVVQLAPLLDKHLRLLEGVEDLAVQELVPELAVEALHIAVLPGASRLDEERARSNPGKPVPHHSGGELRAIVGADVLRDDASEDDDLEQLVDHVLRFELTLHLYRQAFPGVFIQDREYPEGPAIRCPGGHEVIAPDMVLVLVASGECMNRH